MKKMVLILLFVYVCAGEAVAREEGFYLELGLGYSYHENVGLGFLVETRGWYVGAGAGFSLWAGGEWTVSLGVNIDFLIDPEIEFLRGEAHYQVENTGRGASLRILPYLQFSRQMSDAVFMGFGVGYGFNNIFFGMRPLLYDVDFTSWQLSTNSVTPMLFIRVFPFWGSFYFSINYEADIVINGEIRRLLGDPFTGVNDISGLRDFHGVHHRARLVIGFSI